MSKSQNVLFAWEMDMIHKRVNAVENDLKTLQKSYDTLVRLYNAELKHYANVVRSYRDLTEILLQIPEFSEKWAKIHEAPDYDRR